MSRSLSTRAIAAIAVLLAIVIGGALIVAAASAHPAFADRTVRRPPSSPIADAVRRTLAAPAARVRLEATPRRNPPIAGGPHLTIEGVASLSSTDADLVAAVGGQSMRVRMLDGRVWVSLPGGEWVAVPPETLSGTELATWRRFLAALKDDPAAGGPTFDGRPTTVDLDDHGRIRRLRISFDRSTVDLRLDGYDEHLAMPAPP